MTCSSAVLSAYTSILSWLGAGVTVRLACLQIIFANGSIDRGITHIGSNNLFMCYVHVAHDCVVGDNIIMANNTAIAGHVHIGNGAILGGGTLVHQFCRIGQFAMTAAGTVVLQDIPAFVTCSGNRAEAHGMNIEGMRRRGVDSDVINRLREAYKTVYRRGLTLDQAITELDRSC